jgi:glycine/D-amino acid oxidase-like deaminating enzyme
MRPVSPWPDRPPSAAERAAFADAEPRPFWLADSPVEPRPPLVGAAEADLCVVGAGFTGLWAALHAKADDPGRDVVVLEAETAGFGASGRSGGFAEASLTHGLGNGLARFPDELPALERLAADNYAGLKNDLARHAVDCDFMESGNLSVALQPHEDAELHEGAELLRRFGYDADVLDAGQVRAEVASPMYRGALWQRSGAAVVDPAKLALGLRDAALRAGVRICEHTPAAALRDAGAAVEVVAPQGRVRAARVLLATSAFPPLLPAVGRYIAPVYDYALMTEPLNAEQATAVGWGRGQGVSDLGNLFHYYRRTPDFRILFGGYDAVYRYGGPVGPARDTDEATFGRLSQHFFATFPQLEGVRFTHRWGGAIDTCSRFSVFFGTAHAGRVAYAAGYTGLGVVAARFGARVALDLLDGRDTEATRLRYVRSKPVPFPPEPLRTAVIQLTRNRLAAADRRQGRRGVWLRTLDRLGLGFDS